MPLPSHLRANRPPTRLDNWSFVRNLRIVCNGTPLTWQPFNAFPIRVCGNRQWVGTSIITSTVEHVEEDEDGIPTEVLTTNGSHYLLGRANPNYLSWLLASKDYS